MSSTSEATQLRIYLQKKFVYIRMKQHNNDAPTEEQLATYLTSVHEGASEILESSDELCREFGGMDLLQETLPVDTAFDDVDEALETLVRKARSVEMAEASESARPSDDELADGEEGLALAVSRLWELDINRLEPGLDYILNVQGGTKFYDDSSDAASLPLFRWVSPAIWKTRPTYSRFYSLLDNYEESTGVEEEETQEEKQENWAFLDAVLATPVMKYVQRYVASKGCTSPRGDSLSNHQNFKRFLYQTWFYFYKREARNDSSAFEHVFLGEIRDDAVTGMHNWVHIMLEERGGRLNYKGYIPPRRRSTPLPDGNDHVVGVKFDWKGCPKKMSSMFIGTSPEFELALFTLLFASQVEEVTATLENEIDVKVVCHMNGRGKWTRIGSGYPELVE